MKKYDYELPIKKMITNIKNGFKEQGLLVDTRYIENYNICPICETEIKTYRGEVIGVSSVTAFIIKEKKIAVIFCLCKSCAKKVMKSSHSFTNNQEVVKTEEYIFSKFPNLRPIEDGCNKDER